MTPLLSVEECSKWILRRGFGCCRIRATEALEATDLDIGSIPSSSDRMLSASASCSTATKVCMCCSSKFVYASGSCLRCICSELPPNSSCRLACDMSLKVRKDAALFTADRKREGAPGGPCNEVPRPPSVSPREVSFRLCTAEAAKLSLQRSIQQQPNASSSKGSDVRAYQMHESLYRRGQV